MEKSPEECTCKRYLTELCHVSRVTCSLFRCVTRAICDSEKALNSVSRIDRVSRVVFPTTYIVINIIYW